MGHTNHWVVISTIGCEVEVYDSLQPPEVALHTQIVIAKYLQCDMSSITLKSMNIAAQSSSTECGLYAVATITSLAHQQDPAMVVFDQSSMRMHLGECFEVRCLSNFLHLKGKDKGSSED